ncbi:MAG: hypothetical protein ACYCSF_11945 [Acidimicrobiales bacterium]
MVDVSMSRLGLTQRSLARPRGTQGDQALGRFVRVEAWNGLEAGDVVRVAGHSARGRHWRFRAHVTNTSNGASWVEVCLVEGSAPSRRPSLTGAGAQDEGTAHSAPARVERVRSFAPELVTARWRRRLRQHDRSAEPSTGRGQQVLF